MALSDLSLVTNSLLNLLRYRLDVGLFPIWQSGTLPTMKDIDGQVVLSALPGDAQGDALTLRLSLYHVTEDAYLKNQPSVSSDPVPARYNPMGLQLYYQMTAHIDTFNETNIKTAQTLFGLAVKALHDYPYWDKRTQKEVQDFFDANQLSNTKLTDTDEILRITLMHTSPEQAEQFWSSSTKPVRLAAYYMVTAVLLEPEMPTTIPGRVLDVHIEDFIIGAPRLDASTNTIKFTPPDGVLRKLELRPAEVEIGKDVTFKGSALGGAGTTLQIRNLQSGDWPAPAVVGDDWMIIPSDETISMTVQPQAQTLTHGPVDIVPGFYTAAARIPKGGAWQTSNEVPFTVAPTVVLEDAGIVTANVYVIKGGVFEHASVKREHVQVIVGPQAVPSVNTGLLAAGLFEIPDASHLHIQFPISGVIPGSRVPLRIIVNGAESAPLWITAP